MNDRFGRGAAFSSVVGVVQRSLQIIVTLLVMPTVLIALGKPSFGVWAAAASLIWMSGTLDLGVGSALVTDISRAFAANEKDKARRLISAAVWLGAIIAGSEFGLSLILVPRLASAELVDAYLVAFGFMALNVPFSFAAALWAGEQKLYVVWIWEALQSIFTGSLMWGLASHTHDVRFYIGASAGGVLLSSIACFMHFFFVRPELRPHFSLPPWQDIQRLLFRGAPYLILGIGTVLASYSDNIIALSLLGSDAAAVMAISQRASMTATGLLFVLSQPLWPQFANAAARGQISWIRANFWSVSLLFISVAIFGSALIIMFGGQVIDFWLRGSLVLGPEILWAIGISIVVPALGRIPDVLLNALGIVWFQVKIALLFGILAFGLKIVLANFAGVAGIIVASGIAYAFTHLPAYQWWVFRWMRQSGAS